MFVASLLFNTLEANLNSNNDVIVPFNCELLLFELGDTWQMKILKLLEKGSFFVVFCLYVTVLL